MRNVINFRYFKKYDKLLDYFIKGIYAGIMIGVGALCYLNIENKYLGAFLFSLGLLTVCMYGMNLFTGKIGYVVENKKDYWYEVIVGLIGNFVGSFILGSISLLTRNREAIVAKAITMADAKLSDNLLSIFILSVFCGMLIHIAVNNYKKIGNDIGKYSCIFLCVMAFILCGFEHCVANMTYFTIAGVWSWNTLLYELIMILGNACGAIVISLFYKRFYK